MDYVGTKQESEERDERLRKAAQGYTEQFTPGRERPYPSSGGATQVGDQITKKLTELLHSLKVLRPCIELMKGFLPSMPDISSQHEDLIKRLPHIEIAQDILADDLHMIVKKQRKELGFILDGCIDRRPSGLGKTVVNFHVQKAKNLIDEISALETLR